MKDAFISKILAGTLTVASLATSGVAGYKVLAAHKAEPAPVPVVAEASPAPTGSPAVLGVKAEEQAEAAADASVAPSESPAPSATPTSTPSVAPSTSPSGFPVASAIPGGKFDDSSDDRVEIEDHAKLDVQTNVGITAGHDD